VELCLHFSIYLQNEEVIINGEVSFGKRRIYGLPSSVTGIFNGSAQETAMKLRHYVLMKDVLLCFFK
jgi:hypothetical protein